MPSIKGIQCSLLLGPAHSEARKISETINQDTVSTVVEVQGGEFAIGLRLESTGIYSNAKWFTAAINIDNSFKIDRVNAVEITREKPSYTFPIIDAADRKEKNGKWYKQRLVFKPANIQSRSGESEPEVHGEIEVRVWRCAKIGELPKLPDAPHEEPANSKPNVRSTLQNRLRHIACLERTSTHNGRARKRNMKKAKQSKIIDRTFKVKYLDEDDEPYAEFKFLYGSSVSRDGGIRGSARGLREQEDGQSASPDEGMPEIGEAGEMENNEMGDNAVIKDEDEEVFSVSPEIRDDGEVEIDEVEIKEEEEEYELYEG